MSDIKGNIESRTLNRYGKHVMQLYRALNRQYDKEGAISVIGNLIYKNFGYRSAYFDAIEDNEMIIIKNLSYQHVGSNYDAANNLAPEVFNFKIPINGYKGVIYLEDRDSIEKMFPCLDKIASPNILLSIPVFSQNRLIGIFIVYDIYTRKMSPEFKNLMQLAAKEFTAVFSRIEKHSLAFENIMGLTTLGNILLYSLEERRTNFNKDRKSVV